MNNVTTEEIRRNLEEFYLSSIEHLSSEIGTALSSLEKRQVLLAKFQMKVQQTEKNEETKQLMPVFNALMGNLLDFKTFLSACAGGYDEKTILKNPAEYLSFESLPQNLLLLEQQIRTNIDTINSIKVVFDTKKIFKDFDGKITGLVNVLEAMPPILLYNFVLSFEASVLEHLLLHFF